MDIKDLKPRTGAGSLRIADSDELVVMEHFGGVPAGRVRPLDHGLVIICTAGVAQFEYDGHTVQLSKNDLFLLMAHSVVEKFMSSVDFDCRELWFSRGEMWNMNMYVKNSLADLLPLKHNPKVTLSDVDAALFETYFKQLSYHIRNSSQLLYPEITHSIVGAFLLEVLSVLRRGNNMLKDNHLINNSGLHGRKLADRFVQLVEQSDGRIRRVDEFAQMLNVTPKYLSKLLMDTMHRKPSVIVAFFTLQAIENRLRYTDMTMQQIADDLHFANASFFGKYFKEHSGMTPMEYRIKYHQDEKK
ncbi:transcriptional regulator [Xylanibacter ruminicola]|jgi:AraC-like DNA-binding protein|uniref:Transcriptional regulator, AraC family n=2 Tax=Xylanibacter ruminicola TaxID=839 RepID=D5ERQ7_XYLR2|nr:MULTISPECIES: helix-turn-helix transcriptional regulator [Prevotellaceae]ADE82658.1 transcriptional regulator, AraC family [Xylanibacter ruminicola 23]GJG33397.1 transcriptional regulator [Xylanibacter ruminicola]SEI01545.1 AraC-type DNA-binding protein [Xylanibacter ruminicola]